MQTRRPPCPSGTTARSSADGDRDRAADVARRGGGQAEVGHRDLGELLRERERGVAVLGVQAEDQDVDQAEQDERGRRRCTGGSTGSDRQPSRRAAWPEWSPVPPLGDGLGRRRRRRLVQPEDGPDQRRRRDEQHDQATGSPRDVSGVLVLACIAMPPACSAPNSSAASTTPQRPGPAEQRHGDRVDAVGAVALEVSAVKSVPWMTAAAASPASAAGDQHDQIQDRSTLMPALRAASRVGADAAELEPDRAAAQQPPHRRPRRPGRAGSRR